MRGGGSIQRDVFHEIISLKNLFAAWEEFRRGKRSKIDVQEFEFNLENNIFQLHQRLKDKTWQPDPYEDFFIRDPKLRHIHKATIRDRVFNQAVYRVLYQIFDKNFIFDSYSCRNKKGTHRGVNRLEKFIRSHSKNYTIPVYVLKCDVKKFFDSIFHPILFNFIKKKISDAGTLWIIELLLRSFSVSTDRGLPLGNVTSQLFANVYMNEFDQFVKHVLKIRHYIRYADDFVILSHDKDYLDEFVPRINDFLQERLQISLHPNKISIRKARQGIDFLGWVNLPGHRVLRTTTKKRMFKKLNKKNMTSYTGLCKHGNTFKIQKKMQYLVS